VAASLELYLFDSGTLGLGGVEVPVPFFLIRHPRANILVDGGNPLAVARDPHAHWGALADHFEVRMGEQQHCAAQLQRLGFAQASVDYIVQTHLHIDHTGALGHFPDATVIAHRRELDAARAAETPSASGYVREDYERAELRWQLVDGELDLFDDGKIRLLETPGHSAGHMSLLLDLDETGLVLLTADAADNLAQWEGRAHPRALFSREQAKRSLESLRELERETGALLILGHDPESWSRLTHAPGCYR
jgi:N-acyl homoserine lactone hydrolase